MQALHHRRLLPGWVCFAILVLGLPGLLRAESVPIHHAPEFAEGEAAYTQEEAEALYAHVLPLVEKAAGRRFKEKPKFVYATNRETLAAAVAHDLLPQIQKLHPAMTRDQATEIAIQNAIATVPLLLLRYSYMDKNLIFAPKNASSLFDSLKVDAKQIKPVVELVAAFELTHALQDQEIGIAGALAAAKDGEASLALNLCLKGQAAYILDAVAKDLKTPDETLKFARTMAVNVIKRNIPEIDRAVDGFYQQIYKDGLGFVKYQIGQGGMERVWKILAQPPADTNMILKPETYAPQSRAYLDYAKVLDGVEKCLGDDKDWKLQRMSMGPSMLRAAYARLEEAKRTFMVEKIETGQSLVASSKGLGQLGSFTILVFKDAESAVKGCGYLEEFTKNELANSSKQDPIAQISPVEVTDLKEIKADFAHKLRFEVDVPGEPLLKQQVVRMARGRNVLEYVDQNLDLAPAKIAAMADDVFKKLEAAEASAAAQKNKE